MLRYLARLALGTALLGTAMAHGQSSPIIQYDATGNPAVVPSATLPENPAGILCAPNSGGGIDCSSVSPPVSALVDGNGDTLPQTVSTLQADFGLTIAQPVTHYGTLAVDPTYRPQYTDQELSTMGAVTGTQPATLGATYTEGSQFAQHAYDGSLRTPGARYVFLCTGITLDGTKRYCRFTDGAVDATQDDAEILMGAPCAKVKTITATIFDSAGTARSTISSPCTLTVGRSLDNSDSSTLVTVAATAGTLTPTAPASAFGWTGTQEVSLWVQSTGSCGSPSRSVAFVVECY